MHGGQVTRGFHDHGQNQQEDKVNISCEQAPEEFAASFPFSGDEAGKEGGNDIDCGDTDRNDSLRKPQPVHEKCQKQQKDTG